MGLSIRTRIASAAIVGLMFASSAALAQNHFEESSLGEVQNARAQERQFFGHATHNTPGDFVSSNVCVNGYRYITRNIGEYDTPAQNSIPIRC